MFAAEREKNRIHHEKYKDSIRASLGRRRSNPRHQASARVAARLAHMIRQPRFRVGDYPSSNGKAVPIGELLGCDVVTFRKHMQRQFKDGMKWRNYGALWHIGHRVPVRLFNCADLEQLKACFHYLNLQPEFSDENLRRLNEKDFVYKAGLVDPFFAP